MTRALVIGFGSAGQRHARLLGEFGLETAIVSRRESAHPNVFPAIDAAIDRFAPDYVVVANETTAHRVALGALQQARFARLLLVEKPLWSSREKPLAAAMPQLYVGYNLRFHPAIRALRMALQNRQVLSAEIYCGSWLPDWRPGRDYRKTSSALTASGGGALHDLSHELDYANWLFGPWRRVSALGGHLSKLTIETDDVAMILAEMAGCPALSISLNYVERRPRRGMIVNTGEDTLSLDIEAGTLTSARNGAIAVAPFVLDDTYRDQHRAILEGSTADLCDYEHGLGIVDMMAAVEKSIEDASWVVSKNSGEIA